MNPIRLLELNAISIGQNGYLIAWVSYESTSANRVFFDDFNVQLVEGTVLQQDNYYAFGLTFNSYTSGTENKYKYNGMEEQPETGWYQPQEFRMYDPEIGRFLMIDPVIKYHESGYAWNTNNPISYPDPLGSDSTELRQAAETAVQEVKDSDTGGLQPAKCNIGCAKVFRTMTGSNELDKEGNTDNAMLATEMKSHMETENAKSDGSFVVITKEQMQETANNGGIAIAVTDGHVVVAVPGETVASGNFGGDNVPQVMDTGANKRSAKQSMGLSWTSTGAGSVTAYEYVGGTYKGNDLDAVTITGQRSPGLQRKSVPQL